MEPMMGSIFAELRLRLDSLRQDVNQAQVIMRQTQSQFQQSGFAMQQAGQSMMAVGGQMSRYVTLPLVGMGAAAIAVGGQFDMAMSTVRAVSGAVGEDFDSLREKALQLGRDTFFSASQAAQGMTSLGRAGFDTEENSKKSAVMGALVLYLDFINLFLLLLRVLGSRRR